MGTLCIIIWGWAWYDTIDFVLMDSHVSWLMFIFDMVEGSYLYYRQKRVHHLSRSSSVERSHKNPSLSVERKYYHTGSTNNNTLCNNMHYL